MSICFVLTSFTLNRVLELERVAHRKTFPFESNEESTVNIFEYSLVEHASKNDLNLPITFSNSSSHLSHLNTFNGKVLEPFNTFFH